MTHFIHMSTFEFLAAEHVIACRVSYPWNWIATSREYGIRPDR